MAKPSVTEPHQLRHALKVAAVTGQNTARDVAFSQQEFLRDAMHRLELTRAGFSRRISVPEKTLDKWLAPSDTSDFRNMPDVVWAHVREILEWGVKRTRYTPMGGVEFINWRFS